MLGLHSVGAAPLDALNGSTAYIAGSIAGSASESATLRTAWRLIASISGTAVLAAESIVFTPDVFHASAQLSAALGAIRALQYAQTGNASLSGNVNKINPIAGSIAGSASVSGSLGLTKQYAASLISSSNLVAGPHLVSFLDVYLPGEAQLYIPDFTIIYRAVPIRHSLRHLTLRS